MADTEWEWRWECAAKLKHYRKLHYFEMDWITMYISFIYDVWWTMLQRGKYRERARDIEVDCNCINNDHYIVRISQSDYMVFALEMQICRGKSKLRALEAITAALSSLLICVHAKTKHTYFLFFIRPWALGGTIPDANAEFIRAVDIAVAIFLPTDHINKYSIECSFWRSRIRFSNNELF